VELYSRSLVLMVRLENKRRLSQDLSRDVDKINHQLGQLLFAGGKPPDLGKDQPMGGSMDTRRTRTPQSYAGGRNSIGGGAASGSGFGSGSTAPSQAMPWQSAGESTTSTTLPWMSAPPVATCGGGTGLPWDQGAASGSGRNVLGANHRRTSVEALNRAVQQSGLPMGSGRVPPFTTFSTPFASSSITMSVLRLCPPLCYVVVCFPTFYLCLLRLCMYLCVCICNLAIIVKKVKMGCQNAWRLR
jgi:hypothetical protein